MEQFSWNPSGYLPSTKKDQKLAVQELCEAAKYPPDNGRVDLKAIYDGDLVKGWWPEKRAAWKPITTADLDTRGDHGRGGQVWYAATWIHSPSAREVEFRFQGHPQTHLRWFLNDELVPLKPADYKDDPAAAKRPVAVKTLTLRPGWNKVLMRGYCVGYSPFRAGLILNAPSETLWKLRLSATPPPE